MSRTLVVSQPMFLPWIGLFEQVRLSDVFVHYDDVQLPQGRSFISRVQIKTSNGILWLTAPIDRKKSGKLINEVLFSSTENWRDKHLKTIRGTYSRAPHFEEMFEVVREIYDFQTDHLSDFNSNAVQVISKWLGLTTQFKFASESGIGGSSTQRLVDLCESMDCDTYVTGLGALKYLEHEKFEQKNISVRYMNYNKLSYPQMHGEFVPYVSIIDAIANCGKTVRELVCSESVYWKEFSVD